MDDQVPEEETSNPGAPDSKATVPAVSVQAVDGQTDDELKRCDFCGRDETEVKRLIIGRDANICDQCVVTVTASAGKSGNA